MIWTAHLGPLGDEMIGVEYFGSLRIATVVVPVAIYFLVLGLLNSRRHPQLLTSRQDFVLLVAAMSPLVIIPALSILSSAVLAIGIVVGVGAAAVALFAGKQSTSWVIYNLSHAQAVSILERALDRQGLGFTPTAGGLDLPGEKAFVEVKSFPLLRNVSINLRGGNAELAGQISGQVAAVLARTPAQTSPMAVTLLLVATAMMVAPLAMVVQRAPELVRVLSDLLK